MNIDELKRQASNAGDQFGRRLAEGLVVAGRPDGIAFPFPPPSAALEGAVADAIASGRRTIAAAIEPDRAYDREDLRLWWREAANGALSGELKRAARLVVTNG